MAATSSDTASLISHQSAVPGLTRQITSQTARGQQQIFSLDTFSSKDFIVKDFVEALSDSATPARRSLGAPGAPPNAQAQAFDPKPLIRTFEHALTRLKTLSEDLEERENELSGSVRRAEGQHNSNIK